ncbi:condensation domain-containing protein [Rhodohalobacter sp. 8-1]|uniref:condensation domain-containing protein n=1 Tax=Rhodohalobacter sp. 8-1 TaxID=3131972 RepID=UPI0030EBA380
MTKAKLEEVFPLTYNQKILLFHHLSTNEDSGIIQVKCTIDGKLNQTAFTKAWAAVVKQYDVLRTSIQWKNLSKQLQVVQEHAELEIDWIDLEGETDLIDSLEKYELSDREKTFSLSRAPVSRISVFKHTDTQYHLLWTCHHILLDGWSSRLILQEVFRYYDLVINGDELTIDTSIPSMIEYLKAIEKQSQHDEVKNFWKNQIDDKLFPNRIARFHTENQAKDNFKSIEASIPRNDLLDFAKEHRLTLTSLLQTAWLLTLKWFRQNNRVASGTVVSGRAFDFPRIEKLAGFLSNVLPIIHQFQPNQSFVDAAKQIQQHHAKARKYETISIDRIKEWCHWEGNPSLFDTLLIIENFAKDEIASQHLNIRNYKSGLTTTYPITMAVVPGEVIKLHCVWDDNIVDKNLAKQLLNTFKEILKVNGEQRIDHISHVLGQPPTIDINQDSEHQRSRNFVSATTPTELELTKIWQHVLGLKVIGITDNFFALGGKSIQALQLFREIEKSFNKTLLPSVLIQHPTIHQLGKLIADDKEEEFSCLVPLKPNGQKHPLFCIHAGGAHVFLYKKLAESFGEDYPVYAIQPKGLDGGEMHHSIEEMAQDYLKEIQAVTNKQKFYVLGYCFSGVVCLELARIAKERSLEVELIIVDSANLPWWQKRKLLDTKGDLILNVGKKILGMGWQGISRNVKRRIDRVNVKYRGKTDDVVKEVTVKSESDTDHHLERIGPNMIRLNNQYHWNPIQTKVHLIRSSEHINLPERNFHIDIWEILSKSKISTYQVDSKHNKIFEGNSVVEMAKTIERIIGHEIE